MACFEGWESSIPPAVQRRQLPKHSSLRGDTCPVHHIPGTVPTNACVDKNCNCYLCRTCSSVPATAAGAGKLLPCHVLTFVSPKEGLTALSVVSLLIPISSRENQDWNLESRSVLAFGPAAKSMVKEAQGKEVYSNRTLYMLGFFGKKEHFIL